MFQSAERTMGAAPESGGLGGVPLADILQLSQLGGGEELPVDPLVQPASAVDIAGHAQRRTRPWRPLYVTSLVAADEVAALAVMAWARRTDISAPWWYLLLLLSWPALVVSAGAYGSRFAAVGFEESASVVKAAVGLLGLLVGAAWLEQVQASRSTPLLVSAAVLTLGLLERSIMRRLLYRLRAGGHCRVRVLAVGNDKSIDSLREQAAYDTQAGLEVVAACAMPGSAETVPRSGRLRVLNQPADLRAAVVDAGADLVTFTPCPGLDGQTIRRLAWQLEGLPVTVAIIPEIREVAAGRLHARHISGLAVITIDQPALHGFRRVVKHTLDRIAALLLLIVLAPVMLLVALAVRATSEGPALFRQTRISRDGTFTCLKFRSMRQGAEREFDAVAIHNERPEGPHFKIAADPRVTPIGRFLRRYSLDELPQLVNVLTGSMSLVGPRPPLPAEVARYSDDTRRRLLVKPGLTGLWQVSGRASLTWKESLRVELRYVENWSLRLDLLIIWKTAAAVLRGTGAY